MIRFNQFVSKAALLTMVCALLVTGARSLGGNDGVHTHHNSPETTPAKLQANKAALASVKLFDLELTNQDGKTARFKSDVIGDRIVVLDNIYTTCTTICPVLTAIMANVQQKLGERAGTDVFLVSLSVDPVNDTPQRLKAYARRHKVVWNLWTGRKANMDQILKGLGIYTPDFIDHPSAILVGDGKTGEWTRFYGFARPDQLVKKVDELLLAWRGTNLKTGAGK